MRFIVSLLIRLALIGFLVCLILVAIIPVLGRALPPGDVLAFEAGGDLYMIDLTGRLLRLTDGMGISGGVAWSPDGRRLAFVADRTGDREVYVLDVGQGTIRNVSTDPGDDQAPTWSPDGQQLAFVSDRSGNRDIYVLDVGRGMLRNITHHPANDIAPAWSPDGRWLAFCSYRDGALNIHLMDPQTELTHNLSGGDVSLVAISGGGNIYDYAIAWSPDGRRLAFVSNRTRLLDIFIADVQTGALRDVTGQRTNNFTPIWSPDGRWLAFVTQHNTQRDIFVLDVMTGELRNMTSDQTDDRAPAWSPDGTRLAFISQANGADPGLYVVDILAGSQQRLPLAIAGVSSPTWWPIAPDS